MPGVKGKNVVKYVARVNSNTGNNNSKYRYFYSNDAYKAYLNGLHKTDAQSPSAPQKTDHKYIERIDSNGKRRYFYSNEELQAHLNNSKKVKLKDVVNDKINDGKTAISNMMKNAVAEVKDAVRKTVDKTVDKSLEVANKVPEKIDKVVEKTTEVANKLYDDKDNIYDVNRQNYDKKIEKVRASKEWQDIVARKDPEYIKKNADGSETQLIDDYLAKKKNPVLDVVDDIISGRSVSVNKIEKDAVVAGLKEQAFSTVTMGMIALGVGSKLLIEKSKLRQGSYNDEIDSLYENISSGQEYVKKYTSGEEKVSKDDVEKLMKMMENSKKVKDATELAKSVKEENVVNAAKIIMESEQMPDQIRSNEYYKMANDTLSNLSEEEIVMLNILLNSIRNGN